MKPLRYLRDAAIFAPCYILLDWLSYIHPFGAFNITPWNPQPALAIAWMVLGGLAHVPAVLATIIVADALIRDVPAPVTLATALVLACGYAGIAWALRRVLTPRPNLYSLRQLTLFTSIIVPATALIAAGFVAVLHLAGSMQPGEFIPGWTRFWVGDAVGVLVTAPLLLVVADADGRRSFLAAARRGETYLQVALIAATLWLIFAGLGGDPSHHLYLIFLPLIWIAIRNGLAGAVVAVAIIEAGVVLAIHQQSFRTLPVIELQALVAALTLTALYLGVMVDERQRATEGLRQSLRLAAAGEMAGAIAHEVNQPLTALATYGRSTRLLMDAGRTEEAKEVVAKMLAESQRASEVVRRLRDFFREGTTRLERVPVADLLQSVRRIGIDCALTLTVPGDMPDLLVDRLQMELVLRNLVANAAESASVRRPDEARVDVTAEREDAEHVRIVVSDNGPGVSAAMGERVFEPFVSGKSSGMGLGLAVSRAIAEAHGGTLEARAGAHGEFHLVLPVEAHG